MSARGGLAVVVSAIVLALAAACSSSDDAGPAAPPASDAGAETAAAALCVDGKPAVDYPPASEDGYTIGINEIVPPGLVFGDVRIDSYFEPCAEKSRILVIRSTAEWCGTCAWHLENDAKVFDDPKFAGRFALVDLVVADRDNMPSRAEALPPAQPAWKIGADPAFTFGAAPLSKGPLPLYVLVDTKTMKVLSTASNPDPTALANRLETELSFLDKTARPVTKNPDLVDGFFTEDQVDMMKEMKLPDGFAPPPDPTNEYGDDAAAAALGKKLFEDKGLTPSGTVSCSTCHDPTKDLTDQKPQSVGLVTIDRNSPDVALAAHSRWQFWDGRADSLWMQALGPFEDKREMGSTRQFVVDQIKARYATDYTAVFGAKYPLATTETTRIYVNVGKAIAAFERALRVKPNAFDAYAGGDLSALTTPQKDALSQFFKVGCAQCHWGPRFTDDAFHVIRFPTGRQDAQPDRGRFDVLPTLAGKEFAGTSQWSDAPQAAKPLALPQPDTMLGAFKTPSLRGLPQTGPYGHGGMSPGIVDITKLYGTRGLPESDARAIGTTESWAPQFDANVQAALPAFLELLTAEVVIP